MKRSARIALLLALVLLGAGVATSVAPGDAPACRDTTLVPERANATRVRTATLCLINEQRRSRGLPRLRAERELGRAAQRYSGQMVTSHFFDHVAPDGSTLSHRVRRTAYLRRASAWRLGENLAWNIGDHATPATTVATWMVSPAHRVQILQRGYRDLGIGVSSGIPMPAGGPGATYSAVFGARIPVR